MQCPMSVEVNEDKKLHFTRVLIKLWFTLLCKQIVSTIIHIACKDNNFKTITVRDFLQLYVKIYKCWTNAKRFVSCSPLFYYCVWNALVLRGLMLSLRPKKEQSDTFNVWHIIILQIRAKCFGPVMDKNLHLSPNVVCIVQLIISKI